MKPSWVVAKLFPDEHAQYSVCESLDDAMKLACAIAEYHKLDAGDWKGRSARGYEVLRASNELGNGEWKASSRIGEHEYVITVTPAVFRYPGESEYVPHDDEATTDENGRWVMVPLSEGGQHKPFCLGCRTLMVERGDTHACPGCGAMHEEEQ